MSLKAFHIVFVIVSTLLALGFGVWALVEYRRSGDVTVLACGVSSWVGAVALIAYGRWFLRKLNRESFL